MIEKFTLADIINLKIIYEKIVANKLLKMDCFFQEHLWDGYSDINDPKFITDSDFEAIQALTDKINHMIFDIGCPNSVIPMLESIIQRKLKRWNGQYCFYGGDREYKKQGYQIKNKDSLNMVTKALKDEGRGVINNKTILIGHFRWNYRGYILSRRATDLLGQYLIIETENSF
jgi:hypothetical protein